MQIPELANTGVAAALPREAKDTLGQKDFMKLLVAQMENQDPSKPMDNFQFLSQIAQFGMVNGIQNLETSFGDVATSFRQGQVVEATNLLGRKVMSSSDTAHLGAGGTVEGEIELPGRAQNVVLEVRNPGGTLIHTSQFGGELDGTVKFGWNGTNSNGEVVPPGTYRITARGLIEGKSHAFDVKTMNTVDSVTVTAEGSVALTLANGEVTQLDGISQFK